MNESIKCPCCGGYPPSQGSFVNFGLPICRCTKDGDTMNKFIGERLLSITEPWDDDCEEDSMILEFESGSVRIMAADASEPGYGGSPFIMWVIA